MVTVAVREEGDGWVCEVTVEDRGQISHHIVTVGAADLARWGTGDDVTAVDDLVSRSFQFLLEREPASAILKRFDLSAIPRYFPEYHERFKR